MSLWRREPPPEPKSAKQRLEELLYRLADVIGDDDETDRFWSGKVRGCADQVRAGQVWGLRNFLGLFGGMGSINDQRFSQVLHGELSEAYALASELLRENDYEASRHARREIVLSPWSEGSTGKAVVYKDGTVVATADTAPGEPNFEEIKSASRPGEGPVAVMGIKPDGACDVYGPNNCRDDWLAARLQEHHPALHVEPVPSEG